MRSWSILACGLGLVCLAAATAHAQQQQPPARGQGVVDRDRPNYDPAGIRIGSFNFLPTTTVTGEWTDNLFNTDDNTEDDMILNVNPRLEVRSDWGRHELNFLANHESSFHDDNTDEDENDWIVGTDGRIEILRGFNLTAFTNYEKDHEDRGDPDLPSAAVRPTEFHSFRAGGALSYRPRRVELTGGGGYERLDFDDNFIRGGGGGELNNDDRDRKEYEAFVRTGYEFSPGYQAFAEATYFERDYDTVDDTLAPNGSSFRRDSDGYEVLGGLNFDLGAVARGEAGVGYRDQTYDAGNLQDINGISYRAGAEWYVTQLTTISFEGARTVEETTLDGATGSLNSTAEFGIDHELRRNIIISLDAGYENEDFEGINREDDTINAGVEGIYLISRNFRASVGYEFEARDSDARDEDYDNNTVFISIRGAL